MSLVFYYDNKIFGDRRTINEYGRYYDERNSKIFEKNFLKFGVVGDSALIEKIKSSSTTDIEKLVNELKEISTNDFYVHGLVSKNNILYEFRTDIGLLRKVKEDFISIGSASDFALGVYETYCLLKKWVNITEIFKLTAEHFSNVSKDYDYIKIGG